MADVESWFRWMRGLDAASSDPTSNAWDDPTKSHAAWHRRQTAPYDTAPLWTRVYHTVRLLRFPLLMLCK